MGKCIVDVETECFRLLYCHEDNFEKTLLFSYNTNVLFCKITSY